MKVFKSSCVAKIILLFAGFGFIHSEHTFAILHLTSGSKSFESCAIYNSFYSPAAVTLADSPKYPVYPSYPQNGCIENTDKKTENSSMFISSTDGNCTFFEKLLNANKALAKQVIFLSNESSPISFPIGTTDQHSKINFSVVALVGSTWTDIIKAIGIPEYTHLYHPNEPPFAPNLIVIWLIAVFTVVVGSYWSGQTLKRHLEADTDDEDEDDNYSFPSLSLTMVLVFIVMICSVLLLLYYFYKYLIYIVIGIFAIAASQGSHDCLYNIVKKFSPCNVRCRVPENNLPGLKSQPEIVSILLGMLCFGLSIFWIIIRNESSAWILQDFLGVCICLSLLRTFKLPNFKISAVLLIALLVYDIFFVFITPFFSAGKSIMVEVATGRGSKEQLPMVIKVPKLIKTAMSACVQPYSLLGFGDIMLPGLFVAFCHNFDVVRKSKYRVYFIATSVAYGVGLIITFVALLLMKTGQPALLYLSPSVLIASSGVALCRGEFMELWRVQINGKLRRNSHENIEEQAPETNINEDYRGSSTQLVKP